jgi:hypothetical protein
MPENQCQWHDGMIAAMVNRKASGLVTALLSDRALFGNMEETY